MYMHSFDLWVYAFLLVALTEASDVFDEAELAVGFVEDDSWLEVRKKNNKINGFSKLLTTSVFVVVIVVVAVVEKVSSLIDNIMLKSFLHESRNNVTRVDLFKKKERISLIETEKENSILSDGMVMYVNERSLFLFFFFFFFFSISFSNRSSYSTTSMYIIISCFVR